MDISALNPNQKKAVLHKNGPLLILAGAGAGKTKVITYRIVNLIKNGVNPENILAVTFTNKAAKEMKERVSLLISSDEALNDKTTSGFMREPLIKTFHSLGVYLIKRNHTLLGLPKNFSILDSADSRKIIADILKEMDYDLKQHEPKKIQSIISKQKSMLLDSEDYEKTGHRKSYAGDVVSLVWKKYENRLKKEGCLDFDDLLLKTYNLLNNNQDVLCKYQNFWKYIHIDEYQDTNIVQYKITKLLAEKHKNICVVGDIDQNIYSWRGASIENIMNFEIDYPNSEQITLEENYRSTQNILKAANEVISRNRNRKEKNLFTNNCEGDKICVYQGIDEYDEAKFIVKKIKTLLENGVKSDEIAILYRANFQSRVLEEICLQENVQHQVIGTRFFDRKEIKDILAYIKAAANKEDFTNLSRIINTPKRGIGKVSIIKMINNLENEIAPKTREKIFKFKEFLGEIRLLSENKKPHELIEFILDKSGLVDEYKNSGEDGEERLENVKELIALSKKYAIYECKEALEKMLEDVSLNSDQDEITDSEGGVKLMTVHASKGLEFDYVFVAGMESGLFPHDKFDSEEKADSEEERRLFYVAITRAKKSLYLSYASFRTIYGSKEVNIPSEFLNDINENLINLESFSDVDYGEENSYNDNRGDDSDVRPRREYLIDF